MTRLFLSYARGDDEPFVERLYHALRGRDFDVWWDRACMPSRLLTFHQEIRDAISARERLVLVIGPRAVSSDYVRQEWQFALNDDKVVTPLLRLGDYPLVPDELRLLHAEDFRDDARFDFHLDNLARQLSEPVSPLGKLIAVPSLPPHYLARAERLNVLRDALRADLDRPVVIGGAAARVGVHGMGGIGKSVLAAALARDRKVREAFPDGIAWVGFGPLPDVAALQRRVHRDLGGDGAFRTEHEGKRALKELLANRAALLILDDVWRRADVDWFDVLGPRCRALVTTRDLGLLTSLGGVHHVVELL
ncbi:MAG TPA: NB-ARC domain-containing protein, partial [Gemmataceae bacterium]|nr:NB-ARC domain-containing protein [Gemmataceae bacterium]